jgi:hypothetical protein
MLAAIINSIKHIESRMIAIDIEIIAPSIIISGKPRG